MDLCFSCCHIPPNVSYYMSHYTIAPALSLYFSGCHLKGAENDLKSYLRYSVKILSSVSDICIFKSLLPTVPSKSSDSSLYHAFRSVCSYIFTAFVCLNSWEKCSKLSSVSNSVMKCYLAVRKQFFFNRMNEQVGVFICNILML